MAQIFQSLFSIHLYCVFRIFKGNKDDSKPISATNFTLPTHQNVHRDLDPYTELMKLLRVLDNKVFVQLTSVYTGTMSSLYQRDIKNFFEEAKTQLVSKKLNGK